MARKGGLGDYGRRRISESLNRLEDRIYTRTQRGFPSDSDNPIYDIFTSQEDRDAGRRSKGTSDDYKEYVPFRRVADDYPDDIDTLFDLAGVDRASFKVEVTPTLAQYRGPGKSTRVRAVQFAPSMSAVDLKDVLVKAIEGEISSQLLESYITGFMYVRWIKEGNLSSYGPLTLEEFKSRVSSVGDSWGKAVNSWGVVGYSRYASNVTSEVDI